VNDVEDHSRSLEILSSYSYMPYMLYFWQFGTFKGFNI